MLLPLYHHQTSLPLKSSLNPVSTPFSIPKTLILQNPNRSKSQRIRSSASSSTSDSKPVSNSAIRRIAEKLRSLGFAEEKSNPQTRECLEADPEINSAGEIFVPLPNQLPRFRVGHTIDTSWSTPDFPVPEPGSGRVISRYHELRNVWEKEKGLEKKREEKVPTLAELTLPPAELRRLRSVGIGLTKKLKVGKAGITEGIVNGIHERWKRSEVVKIACEDICRMNMKRTQDVLESKTGGLVIWRSGSKILLYRGANYQYPYFISDRNPDENFSTTDSPDSSTEDEAVDKTESTNNAESSGQSPLSKTVKPALVQGVGSLNKVRFQLPGEAQMVEEADRLLDGLGPRFTDWWAYDPLPVDADLLPAIIPGYRRPFRLLPYGLSPKLTNDEMTNLRRLGRPLPCHFALGRNRKLHGLAAAIIKLWEKCELAKIAVKRGVQNTNSEMMAEELKWLTGGALISRDKDFIVLYRGKDFLPSAVSSAIEERRKHVMRMEEQSADCNMPDKNEKELKLGNGRNDPREEVHPDAKDHKSIPVFEPKRLRSPEAVIERTSIKLSMALEKKAKAEKLLEEMEKREVSQQSDMDKEGITEEERFMLRKVGLRMKPFLLLGRRGVFDGTIENMHLHWKYRELVKIICKERSTEAAHKVARILEAESGGILVAVERVSKGYAIIVYRGKNYQRPTTLRPRTLLSKREALKRSLEAQRRESLKLHVLKLTRNIDELNRQLVKDNMVDEMQLNEQSRIGLDKKEIDSFVNECLKPDDEIGSGHCLDLANSSSDEEKPQDEQQHEGDKHGRDLSAIYVENGMEMTTNHPEPSQEDTTGFGFSEGHESKESSSSVDTAIAGKNGFAESSYPNESMVLRISPSSDDVDAEQLVSTSEKLDLTVQQAKHESQISVPRVVENASNGITSRSIHLSNKERLVLRKQALKMKKRPPFAVGRSNVVIGLAKAIKAHFQKQPLAIVTVKGRAKGTSVQEIVSKLQEETGALLVSQEPSKVILYRGWGAENENSYGNNKNIRNTMNLTSVKRVLPPVSPELMEAIRLECGLLDRHNKETTSEKQMSEILQNPT